jgi:transposase
MNTEISAHDLHVYLALLAADKLEPENCISILTQVLEDDIDKTNRIASLLSTIRKASDDYNDLLKRYEDLQEKEKKEKENNQLGRRGTYGVKSEHLTAEELRTGMPKCKADDPQDPLSEDPSETAAKESKGTSTPSADDASESMSTAGNAGNNAADSDEKSTKESGGGKKEPKKRRSSRPPRKPLSKESKERQKRTKGTWEEATAHLPHRVVYDLSDIDADKLKDPKYASLVRFEKSEKLGYKPAQVYVEVIIKPTIAYTKEAEDPGNPNPERHEMERTIYRPHSEGYIMPGSRATPEIVAEFYYQLTVMYLSYNRISIDITHLGYPMDKQKVVNWCDKCAERYLLPVYDALSVYIMEHKYSQMDETTWQSIYDSDKAGEKSYIWLLVTSELLDCPKAAVYYFNPSRSEEFLENLYADYLPQGDDSETGTADTGAADEEQAEPATMEEGGVTKRARIVIKDDAYAAYTKLEKKSGGAIAVSFCLAHLRRYFYLAWLIMVSAAGKKAETQEGQKELSETWEWKILYELSVAEKEDTGLKKASREERLDGRIARVKPHLDKAYQYVCEYENQYQESLKASNGDRSKRVSMSATMRKAMTYFENAKKDNHIDSFIYDPDIPADNSFSERLIRPIGIQRSNSLFSYSDEGAICRMIANSISKTAQLNNADPWYYFLYLLREIPKYQERKVNPEEYMPKMMPWSDEYRSFETREKELMLSEDTLGLRSEEQPILREGEWIRTSENTDPKPAA